MKTKLLSLALISAFSSAAYAAAPTSELTVIGSLTVPNCTVAPTAGGVYDYEKQASTLIKPSAVTVLSPISHEWKVSCDAETYLTYSIIDNQEASAAAVAATNFGLGNVNGTGKIGNYSVVMRNATVDTVASQVFASATAAFTPAASVTLNKNMTMGWAGATANTLRAGREFVMDLDVTATLASSATMNGAITEEVPLDGSLTLNFAFGI